MHLLGELSRTVERLFTGNNDEIIFFAIVFLFMLFNNSREDRAIDIDNNRSNTSVIFIIIAFLFMFMATERSDEITLINEP
jgi:preprotein translocase subunit SecG